MSNKKNQFLKKTWPYVAVLGAIGVASYVIIKSYSDYKQLNPDYDLGNDPHVEKFLNLLIRKR